MGFTTEERRAIYCHELGHCFSSNQGQNKNSKRNIDDEVDSDTFAVKQCDVPPRVLKSALKKSYEYEIAHIDSKKDLTQERFDRYVEEMKARKANANRLIIEVDNQNISI
jgi:hypothetical protein